MTKMHEDELEIDSSLVSALISSQFPQWERLPLERVRSDGTDNAIFRLGDDMAVRLPRLAAAASQAAKEHRWLPRLAPHLPLAVPVPLGLGAPGAGFPWHWSVCRWVEGVNATPDRIADPAAAAAVLGRFVAALQTIDATGGPPPGDHNFWRGVPLAERDDGVRESIARLHGTIDVDAAAKAWEAALDAPAWDGPPVWIHADLQSGNLLATERRLSAVIDFGALGIGDPACDVMAAWTFLPAGVRDVFRAEVSPDDATWARARGWALSVGLIALPYYRETNPGFAARARHWIEEVVADHRAGTTRAG